jgi:hypothetical protein
MAQSAHPMSDGKSQPRTDKDQHTQRGEPFSDDDLQMDTSRYTSPYSVQTSTEANLPLKPEVLEERTKQEGDYEEGGEARYE